MSFSQSEKTDQNEPEQQSVDFDISPSHLLAGIDHKVRTTMNAVIGFSQMLADEQLTEQQKEYTDIIRNSAANLIDLTQDILYLYRLEIGELKADITEYSVERVFANIESAMRKQAKQKGLAFEILQSTELPEQIRTDPFLLHQCLDNLVHNAVKFTQRGHVYLDVSLHYINSNPYICFDVEDTGIGIKPQEHKTIFMPSMENNFKPSQNCCGTGLGLAIAKKAAALLEGDITLNSSAGKGSVFSLKIPAGVDVNSVPSFNKYCRIDRLKEGLDTAETDLQNRTSGRVLVAEDNKTNQLLLRKLLERLGLEVAIAEDGEQAVAKATNERFDMVFMDIQMPKMDGYQATKLLREKGLETPIIAVTANAIKGDKEKCLAAGCDAYLAKPINAKLLSKVADSYLNSPKATVNEEDISGGSRTESFCGCEPDSKEGLEQ